MQKQVRPRLASGYGLWFVPEGRVLKEARKVIVDLSARYSAPVFEPHVTLLGVWEGAEAEALALTQDLARRLDPVPIRFGAVEFLQEYYRCLFLRAENSPKLNQTYSKGMEIFYPKEEHRPSGEYMPHLSLLYGHYEVGEKKKLAMELNKYTEKLSFTATKIGLYFVEDEIENWKLVEEFRLA